MVEESRRSHLANRLPCPQSGFRDFRGTKRRAVYWRSECHEYTKTAPRVAAPSGCLRQGDMRPNQARRFAVWGIEVVRYMNSPILSGSSGSFGRASTIGFSAAASHIATASLQTRFAKRGELGRIRVETTSTSRPRMAERPCSMAV